MEERSNKRINTAAAARRVMRPALDTLPEGGGLLKGVGFDLGETLVEYEGVPLNWEREYPAALAAIASLWAGTPTAHEVEAGSAVLRCYNTRLNPRTHEVATATVFVGVLQAIGVSPEDAPALLHPAVDAFFAVFQRRVRAFGDVAPALHLLHRHGVRVGVLTDVPYAMPRRLVLHDLTSAGLDDLAASTLTSTEVGTRKPDPNGFAALAEREGCQCAEMLFVGNEQKDVVGAKAAGMQAALLWRDQSPVPSWGQDVTITSLDGLPSVVLEGRS
jgi:putative hydrolase of the HAD superfamily